jgi:hypothetical protein
MWGEMQEPVLETDIWTPPSCEREVVRAIVLVWENRVPGVTFELTVFRNVVVDR